MSSDPKTTIRAELTRIEEDCVYSGKAQFNAGVRWGRYHLWLGVPSVILSALAGTAFFKGEPEIAGAMSTIVTILTALMTFLKPSERASSHKSSGDQYLKLAFSDVIVIGPTTAEDACLEKRSPRNFHSASQARPRDAS